MKTLSVCMIVKNEQEVIERALKSIVSFADEIIIVDTGSNDNTKKICEKYTDKIYDFKWINDFSAARNYSFSKATKDYIMWLDADDIVDKDNAQKFISLKENLNNEDIVMCNYNVAFDENDNPTFSYLRERLVKREKNYKWEGKVHEVIVPNGIAITSDAAVSHKKIKVSDSDRNLNIYKDMQKNKEEFTPRNLFYFARELYYHKEYKSAIKMFNKFLSSNKGWYVNNIEACEMLGFSYQAVGKPNFALESFFKSFTYDLPHAEICVDIGNYFLENNNYNLAIYWYDRATCCKKDYNFFVRSDCYDFIPYIQTCVAYYNLGNLKKAEEYNKKAEKYKPDDKAVLLNKEFFAKLKNKS